MVVLETTSPTYSIPLSILRSIRFKHPPANLKETRRATLPKANMEPEVGSFEKDSIQSSSGSLLDFRSVPNNAH